MIRLVALIAALASPCAAGAEPVRDLSRPMYAVPGYDRARLIGDWYELARSDSMLERDCYAVTTSIAPRDDSRLTLKLACHKGGADGPLVPIEGVLVEVAPGLFQLRLVRLAQLGNLDLAVLWAAPDDSMVVIGSGLGQVGWVLAKSPDADSALGVEVLIGNGYAPKAISLVEQ